MPNLVNLTIDGKAITCDSNMTILKAAEKNGIDIPRLCFMEGINESSSCRICVVEIEGQRTLKTSCSMKVADGMVVKTNTKKVRDSIVKNLQLIAANHTFECWKCSREHSCEFLDLLKRYQVENKYGEDPTFEKNPRLINSSVAMVLDSGKCTLCGRCVAACEVQSTTGVLNFNHRGAETYVGPALNHNIDDSGCIYCGKCIQACPVAAIQEKDDNDQVQALLDDPSKFVVIQAAPAVRTALGEEFGYEIGTDIEGKMYAAMKALGFDDIVDVNFGADLTIMEEGYEFIDRIQNGGKLPQFTSCSPGWIRYIEQYAPEYLDHLSSAKSPQQMIGATVKQLAHKFTDSKDKELVLVSVMPCIAKKYEAARPEMEVDGVRDVDVVITTREFARLIKRNHINFRNLEDYKPSSPLASYTGAGTIFGVTGGVMEAAIRTVTEVLEGKETQIDFESVRGFDGIKEASVEVAGTEVNVAVVHGGAAIKEFLQMLKTTDKQYHFVEFMGCIGGCINGGGQPIVPAKVQENVDVFQKRASVLYNIDSSNEKRKSHLNEAVQDVYKELYGKPNSHKAHECLHTTYKPKKFYN